MAKSRFATSATPLIKSAQKTHDDVEQSMWRFKLRNDHLDEIIAKLEQLKFEIGAAKEFLGKYRSATNNE